MPLPTFATLEEVPEAFRSEYEMKDGKAVPKTPTPDLGDAGKAAIEKERNARKAEKDRADAAEKERDELKRAAEAREKGISAEQLQKIKDDEAKARKPLEDKIADLEAKDRKHNHTDKLRALALKKGVMEKRIDKAMVDLERRTDLADDGKTIVVKDAAGNVTTQAIEEFLEKTYKEEAPFFYEGVNSSGTGAEQDLGGGGGSTYDAAKAGKEAAAVEKAGREAASLAFK